MMADTNEKPADDTDDVQARAEAIADILGGLFGDAALDLIPGGQKKPDESEPAEEF